jgi:hypothetical protein
VPLNDIFSRHCEERSDVTISEEIKGQVNYIDSKIVYDAATIELKELKIKIQSIDFKDY